jgi:hypothetical protein
LGFAVIEILKCLKTNLFLLCLSLSIYLSLTLSLYVYIYLSISLTLSFSLDSLSLCITSLLLHLSAHASSQESRNWQVNNTDAPEPQAAEADELTRSIIIFWIYYHFISIICATIVNYIKMFDTLFNIMLQKIFNIFCFIFNT